MSDVFVNYRTGDEESAATMVARELVRRFGAERIFFASSSIEPGQRFPAELVRAVEECEALLAVIGPRWAEVGGGPGRPPPPPPPAPGPPGRQNAPGAGGRV
ncbi:TIR domain-containing protein, partial [Streptomyces californicus]|uniref:TIR domain-containing protein n=1 Tax=Streptomyces californicus TaxID=67351 RepID=UPI003688CED5